MNYDKIFFWLSWCFKDLWGTKGLYWNYFFQSPSCIFLSKISKIVKNWNNFNSFLSHIGKKLGRPSIQKSVIQRPYRFLDDFTSLLVIVLEQAGTLKAGSNGWYRENFLIHPIMTMRPYLGIRLGTAGTGRGVTTIFSQTSLKKTDSGLIWFIS